MVTSSCSSVGVSGRVNNKSSNDNGDRFIGVSKDLPLDGPGSVVPVTLAWDQVIGAVLKDKICVLVRHQY